MVICILATSKNVEAVRERAYLTFPKMVGHKILSIPLSENGEAPITHWFCSMHVDDEMYEKLMQVQNLSIMEIANPKDFLAEYNLKVVMG